MDEPYQPKIVHLPGTELTPEVVLHRVLDKLPRIRSVMVLVQWDDLSMGVDWSQMKISELCMAGMVVQQAVFNEMDDGTDK